MMECPWGFNQYVYCEVMGGSASCSCFAVALLVCPVDTMKKGLSTPVQQQYWKQTTAALKSSSTNKIINWLNKPGTA